MTHILTCFTVADVTPVTAHLVKHRPPLTRFVVSFNRYETTGGKKLQIPGLSKHHIGSFRQMVRKYRVRLQNVQISEDNLLDVKCSNGVSGRKNTQLSFKGSFAMRPSLLSVLAEKYFCLYLEQLPQSYLKCLHSYASLLLKIFQFAACAS